MKRLLIVSLFGSFAFAAAAQNATDQASTETRVDTGAQVETEAGQASIDTRTEVQKDADRNCIRYTGTRITTRKMEGKDCVLANGRVYSRQDIESTGETDIADALRKLDPAVY